MDAQTSRKEEIIQRKNSGNITPTQLVQPTQILTVNSSGNATKENEE